MKVGSLVECVSNHLSHEWGGTLPIVGNIYTVRDVTDVFGSGYIKVEEIIDGGRWQDADWYREVQPPISLEFIEELQFSEQDKVYHSRDYASIIDQQDKIYHS